MFVLNVNRPLKDYRSTRTSESFFLPEQLSPMVTKTRQLLNECFLTNFFSRHTDREKIKKSSYVLEMQMMLHPLFKRMKELSTIMQLCNSQLGAACHTIERIEIAVKDAVKLRLQTILQLLATDSLPELVLPAGMPTAFADERTELFGSAPTPVASAPTRLSQVEEELERWLDDPAPLF
uniref:Uncharacterized protein n=1 Tax=Globisporangium ultimum (strain ATCC 200006 / CBS 805.95 / DAOM BR144) TaxID=431595 RepID=K3W9B4_GLOUD